MKCLVTGGCGYIGAHVVRAMTAAGDRVVVLDDLSSGDQARIPDVPLVVGSVLDRRLVESVLSGHDVQSVVHLAAKKRVEESVCRPTLYYRENVEGLRVLLEAATHAGVESFVFSSSAAVYGAPDVDRVDEDVECRPVNPYGRTKLVGEWMVADTARATGLRYANLRYFNVAGTAAPELTDRGESSLVPLVFRQLARQRAPRIFGDDYDTADGTCIRDFVHVADIASAHVAAARALTSGAVEELTANIGRGAGISVLEMVEIIRSVTGVSGEPWSAPVVEPRRAGDPARVVASAERIAAVLGWEARHGPREMVASAWAGWSRSVGALPAEHRPQGLAQDHEVECE
ncbi:UDP-glucose 4-epimerase GalE [Trujillonella endophytica]|uniref:UDP-glucose 4-epimerase n=1 Tax=Trujillonella endophytica TaxID=673521 RepID=A0A1H8W5E6_9ACTN|nr:UDP-glucose 4-epimerase GalE [Trujillella endophytica]SEP22866.1 UDP-galactose 4-epimerase [Trujillella endophytica]